MPPRKGQKPKYCRHKASGLGYVTDPANGKEVWFGPHGAAESLAKYDAWLRAFLDRPAAQAVRPRSKLATLTMSELLDAYLAHASGYYRKRGKETSEVGIIRAAVEAVNEDHGTMPANTFGPAELKAVRAK